MRAVRAILSLLAGFGFLASTSIHPRALLDDEALAASSGSDFVLPVMVIFFGLCRRVVFSISIGGRAQKMLQ